MNATKDEASKRSVYFQTFCAALVLTMSAGCTTTDTATQSYKGVINLDGVRLGLPEESAKSAILTFVHDPSVNQNGYTQYLSRVYDKDNGQYCLGYFNGVPKQVRVVYSQAPVPKETAMARLKMILPSGAPEETKVDDPREKSGKKGSTVEIHFFGDKLKAEVIYSDKSASLVKLIGVSTIGDDAKADSTKTADGAKPAEVKKTD